MNNKRNDYSQSKPSFKKNLVFNFLTQLITFLVPLFVTPYISRILGTTGLGSYSYYNSFVSYFSIAIAFGFTSYGTKRIANKRNNKQEYSNEFWNIFFSRFAFFLIVSALFFLLLFNNVFGSKDSFILLLVCSLTLLGQATRVDCLYSGLEKFSLISIANLIFNILFVVLVFSLVRSSDDLIIYVALKSIQVLTVNGLLWLFAISRVSSPKLKDIHIIKTFRGAASFVIPTISATIASNIDQTMIGSLVGLDEVALYEQPLKIISLVLSVVFAFTPVMFSRITFLYKEKRDYEVKQKIEEVFELCYLIIIPSVFGLICIAPFFIPAYFGSDFSASVGVLYCLIPMLLFSSTSSLLQFSYFYPKGKEKKINVFFIITIVANVSLNALLIPEFGAKGAAISSSISEFLMCLLCVVFSWKEIDFVRIWKKSWKILVSSLLMAGFTYLSRFICEYYSLSSIYTTLICLLVGVSSYCLFCFLLSEPLFVSITKGAIQKIKNLVLKNKNNR